MEGIIDLEDYRLENAPQRIYYVPNFISKEEELFLKESVYKAPKPRWTQLQNRRLQNWGGVPHPKGMIAEKIPPWLQQIVGKVGKLGIWGEGEGGGGGKQPNHVLVNEYLAGQGIMPHLDGPLFYPTISTVNLGGHGILNFYEPTSSATEEEEDSPSFPGGIDKRLAFSLYLEPRSLLILQDKCYHHYLHGIQEKTEDNLGSGSDAKLINLEKCLSIPQPDADANAEDNLNLKRTTRVSLTIRHVPKTTKAFLLRLGN